MSPQARDLKPKTVEGHGAEAMTLFKTRDWFEFGITFPEKSCQPRLKFLLIP